MREAPAISVVTSVYNGLPYLPDAIRSILSQTLADFEYLIIDDGSTDGSWEVLRRIASQDGRIVLLRNDGNRGFALAQNRAFGEARGEFIACQDQDDISMPTRLARQLAHFAGNPSLGLVGAWPGFLDPSGAAIEQRGFRRVTGAGELARQIHEMWCFCGPSMMIRRSVFEHAGGYDPAMTSAEDYDLLLRVSELCGIDNVPDELYLYRQHAASATHLRPFLTVRNYAFARERALRRIYGGDIPQSRSAVVARDFAQAAELGFAVGNDEEACRCLAQALTLGREACLEGGLLEKVLWNCSEGRGDPAAFEFVEAVFERLHSIGVDEPGLRSRLLSRLHMREAFREKGILPERIIRRHLGEGAKNDPRWLLRASYWKAAYRAILTGNPVLPSDGADGD